jgi:hypothetical protein
MATHHSHLRFALFDSTAEELCNFGCHDVSARSAAQPLQIALRDTGLGESTAASLATATTVGTWQNLGNLINQWVFHHLEFFGYKIEHHGEKGANHA